MNWVVTLGGRGTDENEDHRFTFPENSIIGVDSYIVLAQDTSSFSNFFPQEIDLYGSFDLTHWQISHLEPAGAVAPPCRNLRICRGLL